MDKFFSTLASVVLAISTAVIAYTAWIGIDAYKNTLSNTSAQAKHDAAQELLKRVYVVRDVFDLIRIGAIRESHRYKQPIAEDYQQQLPNKHPVLHDEIYDKFDSRWLRLQNALAPYFPAFYAARALFGEKLDEPKNQLYECVNIYTNKIDWLGGIDDIYSNKEPEEAKEAIKQAWQHAMPYIYDERGAEDKNITRDCVNDAVRKYEFILKAEVPTLNLSNKNN